MILIISLDHKCIFCCSAQIVHFPISVRQIYYPLFSTLEGTAKYIADYNRIDTITTVVDDSKVDSIVSAIMDSAYRGNDGDGMIFVSAIEEAYKIGTKEKMSSLSQHQELDTNFFKLNL